MSTAWQRVETFHRQRPRWRQDIDVSIDDDGYLGIEWSEPADDHHGTATRSVAFSADEFDRIVEARDRLRRALAQASASDEGQRP